MPSYWSHSAAGYEVAYTIGGGYQLTALKHFLSITANLAFMLVNSN